MNTDQMNNPIKFKIHFKYTQMSLSLTKTHQRMSVSTKSGIRSGTDFIRAMKMIITL